MAHTPHTYATGDTITAALLNAAETDLAAATARANHTGTQSADTLTDGTTNKAFLATERTKLAGVATGATANSTDAQLRDRSTHTGTQAASTVTGLAAVATTGAYADVTGKPAIPPVQTVTTTTVTTAATAAINTHTLVDATTAAVTITLPAGAAQGSTVTVEKEDVTTNAVTLSGSIRGSAATIALVWQYESVSLIADASGSWWPRAGHKTKASLDAAYAALKPSGDTTGAADTTAIQAAINAAATAGGGRVFLGAGTFTTTGLTLNTGVWLVGQGYEATKLVLANAANAHAVQTLNFGTLTGTDTTATPYNFGVESLTIDGNKANQTGAWHGLAIYGYSYAVRNVMVRNASGVGLWTEWGQQSTSAGNDSMEAFITDFKIHDCNGVQAVATHGGTTSGAGIVMLGPHDSQFSNGIVYNCGTDSGAVHNGMAAIDVPAPNFGNGTTFDNIHVWGGTSDYGIRIAGAGISLGTLMQVEGGRVAQLLIDGGSTVRVNGKLFSGGVSTASTKGLIVRNGGSAASGFLKIENCGGGVIDWTGAGGDHDLKVHATHTTQAPPSPATVGSLPSNTCLELVVTDTTGALTADTKFTFGGTAAFAGLVSGAPFLPARPNSGEYFVPPQGSTTTSSAITQGTIYFAPVDVPVTTSCQGLGSNLSAVGVGGTSPLVLMGVYADDGTGARPAAGSIITGTQVSYNPVTQATGDVPLTFGGGNIVFKPGRYWIGFLVTAAAAMTTAPTFVTNNTVNQHGVSDLTNGSRKCWAWSGSGSTTATSMPTITTGGLFRTGVLPNIGLRVA